ncbi:MAG: PAS domain S-box protein, partial [Candidatus Cloacimonetes bacterium]|nr:PAS domain S-box protein [Candidatus Cloacimonadota bacterium]
YGDFEGLSWILLVEHSVEEILEPVFSLRKKVIAVSAILILISIILAIIISHSISSPLKKLIKGVKIIGKGELNYKLDIDREDEIGHLAKKFNEMTENLREVTVSRDELDQEIKERQSAEKEVIKSEKKYRKLFETMEQGVVYQNAKGEIISANPAAERILGLTQDQMKGRTSMDPSWKAVDENKNKLPGEKHPAMIALKTGEKVENFVQGIYNPQKNGYTWIIVNCIPQFKKGKDEAYQVHSIFLDITQRKQAEEELQKYREHLEELVEERTEELKETQKQLMQREKLATLGKFAGGLAHEIKNPLAVIDSSLVYLQYQDYKDEKLLKHMERIRTSIKKADEIIDSLRRLSKIQKPEKTKLNINKLLQEISAETGISDKIELDLNLPEREIFINGDEVQLSLALKNIIKNAEEAIEDEGAIDIKLELLKSEKCKIIIRDTGKGIEDNELKQIFEPLYSTKSSGLGFGLSLVKQIIELHNGKLKVESNPGKGTKFKIVLPTT